MGEGYGIQVRAWAAVGAMTTDAIFARADEIMDGNTFRGGEETSLKRNFRAISDGQDRVSEAAFTKYMLEKIELSPKLTEAVKIVFDVLCFLSTYPLRASSPLPEYLTLEGLTRALMWLMHERMKSVIQPDTMCDFEPANNRRFLFQGLAMARDRVEALKEGEHEKDSAVCNLSELTLKNGPRDTEAGAETREDEMFLDMLDFLVSTQPYVEPTYGAPDREAYRPMAAKLLEGAPLVSELRVPKHRLKVFLSLLIAKDFEDGDVDVDEYLEAVAGDMAASFCHGNEESTWPMFDIAISKLLCHILDPLYHLLSTAFLESVPSFDAHLGDIPVPVEGAILTIPRIVQLETVLFNSCCIPDIRRFHAYSDKKKPTTLELVESIKALPESALLVVSSLTPANEAFIFSVFIGRPLVDGPCIQDGKPDREEAAVLFQLSPCHDVFRGRLGAPAWSVKDGELVFGKEGHGAALVIDCEKMEGRFTHHASTEGDEDTYRRTAHRGDFEEQFVVKGMELWGEGCTFPGGCIAAQC